MKNIKKLSAMILALSMILTMTAFATTNTVPNVDKSQMTASAISAVGSVYLNNVKMTIPDGYGYFWVDANGRTQAPVRALVEAMGYTISYDKGVVTVPGGPKGDLKITIGSNKLDVGGTEVVMDTIGATIDGRTYVPLRYVSESLGATVEAKGTANGLEIRITTTFTPEKTINGVADKDFEDCPNFQAVIKKYSSEIYNPGNNMVRFAYNSFNMTINATGGQISIRGINFIKEADKQYEMIFALIDDMVEESSRQAIKDLLNERREALNDGWVAGKGYGESGLNWVETNNKTTKKIGNVNVDWSNSGQDLVLSRVA